MAARAGEGDVSAFEELIEAVRLMVINTAMQYLGDREDAMDCSQDVFLSAYRNINNFRGGSFRGWIYSITRNRCLDILRTRKPGNISLDTPPDEDGPEMQIAAPEEEMPEEYVIRKRRQEAVRRAVSRLPVKLRDVVILRNIQELSYEETADALGIPVGTVKSRLNAAAKALRKELEADSELFE